MKFKTLLLICGICIIAIIWNSKSFAINHKKNINRKEIIAILDTAIQLNEDYKINRKNLSYAENEIKSERISSFECDRLDSALHVCADYLKQKEDTTIVKWLIKFKISYIHYESESIARLFTQAFINAPDLMFSIMKEQNDENRKSLVVIIKYALYDCDLKNGLPRNKLLKLESLLYRLHNKE